MKNQKTNLPNHHFPSQPQPKHRQDWVVWVLMISTAIAPIRLPKATAQSDTPPAPTISPKTETYRENAVEERKERQSPSKNLTIIPKENQIKAAKKGDPYILEFNRSPVVGTRFSLRGIYDEARLGFTKPREWKLKTVKALIKYRHSPALYATRSNLTVMLNGASVGSIPLNRKEGEIGTAIFDIPIDQIQNYNQITIAALQNNSPTCTQDPYDPSLWTEILPDSKITFDYDPQAIDLNFNQYPYPIFDELSLYPNTIAYLLPQTEIDSHWLTTINRYQTSLGRIADYRPLDTRLIKTINDIKVGERLIIIGTPTQQQAISTLKLPIAIKNNQLLDEKQKPLPPDTGVLILTTAKENSIPVLIATGNSPTGVGKAIQFLIQTKDIKIATGQKIIVETLNQIPSPPAREWPRYLPLKPEFTMRELTSSNNQPLKDITVRGSDSPPIVFDFRALPDDQFKPNNFITLNYSYGPQINAKTSLVEIKIDDVALIGKRLTSINGGQKETLKIELPPDKIKPTSKIQVDFRLDARERRSCSKVTDQQLWGTLHSDTSFQLNRTNSVQVPDLKLLQYGFPFAAPQDLSATVIVLPKTPKPEDIITALEMSTRLGRLTTAQSVQLSTYTIDKLPQEIKTKNHLIAIGIQKDFPFPEIFSTAGIQLKETSTRILNQSKIQTSPDYDGVVKQIISPWNKERILTALSGQTTQGLSQVQNLIHQDPLFFQIQGDTVLISANTRETDPNNPNAYNLKFLQQEAKQELEKKPLPNQLINLIQTSWFMLGPAMVAATLIIYGLVQLYLKRVAG